MTATQRREQILDITHTIVDAEGFHAATPNRIATEAGITRPVLYQQFGDLAGLFVALIDREAERAASQFTETIANPTDPDQSGLSAERFEGLLRAIDTHPATWRLFLVPPQGAPPALHERLARAERNVQLYLQAELTRLFPDLPDPDYASRAIHAAGRELLRLRLADPENATIERLRSLVRDLTTPLASLIDPR